MYLVSAYYGAKPSQYIQSQSPINAGFYLQQATSMAQYQRQYQLQQQQQL